MQQEGKGTRQTSGSSTWEQFAASQTVYDVYTSTRRRVLLALVAAVYPLLPLSDTILLTQMPTIALELGASSAAVTATLSLYLAAAAAGFALWGPAADLLGRLVVFHAALGLFLGSSVGCALAPSIALFLAGRAVQGLAAAGTWAVGNAVVADVYPIETRGVAFGVFMMPGMLGPVIAPFIGAALTQAFGWRSMMWFLAILSGAAQLVVLLVYRETQHHRVARRVHRQLKQQHLPPPAWVLQSTEAARHTRPHPKALLQLLGRLLSDPTTLPFMLLQWHTFGCMFLLLLQLSEVLLGQTSLSPTKVGLCYFATGFCSMAGSWLGGWAADRTAAAPAAALTARVEGSSFTSLMLIPSGLLLVGWAEPAGWRNAAAIAAALAGWRLAGVLHVILCAAWRLLLPVTQVRALCSGGGVSHSSGDQCVASCAPAAQPSGAPDNRPGRVQQHHRGLHGRAGSCLLCCVLVAATGGAAAAAARRRRGYSCGGFVLVLLPGWRGSCGYGAVLVQAMCYLT